MVTQSVNSRAGVCLRHTHQKGHTLSSVPPCFRCYGPNLLIASSPCQPRSTSSYSTTESKEHTLDSFLSYKNHELVTFLGKTSGGWEERPVELAEYTVKKPYNCYWSVKLPSSTQKGKWVFCVDTHATWLKCSGNDQIFSQVSLAESSNRSVIRGNQQWQKVKI